jgi:hypothetical protein
MRALLVLLFLAVPAFGALERQRPEIMPRPEAAKQWQVAGCPPARQIRWWVRRADGTLKMMGQTEHRSC